MKLIVMTLSIMSKALVFAIFILPIFAKAQEHINADEVARIHLIDAAGYIMGGFRNEYDMVREGKQWATYQTREKFDKMNMKAKTAKEMRTLISRDTLMHQFITHVSNGDLQRLLKAIEVIKPKFNAADLKISIPIITKQIDTGSLKYLNQEQIALYNSFFDTPKKLNKLLDTLQHDFWTDDYPNAAMEIIKTTGDTIKVYTRRQVDFMLPWIVNNTPSYDLAINKFFLKATGLTEHRMSGKYLSYHLSSWVSFLYANDALGLMQWQKAAPENLAYIKENFDIIKSYRGEQNSSFTFHPKTLNKHILITGQLNIKDSSQLRSLVRLSKDTLSKIIKAGGIMIDSCLHMPGCTINFTSYKGQSYHEVYNFSKKGLEEYIKQYKLTDLWPFTIRKGARLENNWVALPGHKFLLSNYIDDHVIGISPRHIPKGVSGFGLQTFTVFSADGTMIYQGGKK